MHCIRIVPPIQEKMWIRRNIAWGSQLYRLYTLYIQYTLYYTGFHDPTLKYSNWHTTATASSNGILLILVALPMCDTYSWREVRCWSWCWAISSQTLWNTLECGGGGHQYLTRRLSLSSHFLLRLIGQLYHTSMFLYQGNQHRMKTFGILNKFAAC